MPAPAVEVAPFVDERDADGVAIPDRAFEPPAGDIVVPEANSGAEVAPSP
jgi:hypothetical protein